MPAKRAMPIRGPRGSVVVGLTTLMKLTTAAGIDGHEPEKSSLPVTSRLSMMSSMLRDACAAPEPPVVTELMPTIGQKAGWWVRFTVIDRFSRADDGVAPAAGVDVGNASVIVVPGVCVATPFSPRY